MAGELGSLVLSLQAETAQFRADLGRAAHIAAEHSRSMQTAFTNVGNAITGVLGVAGVGGLSYYVKSLVDAAEHTNKLAVRTGHAVGFLSELGIAAQESNVSVDELGSSLGKFNLSLSEARDQSSKTGQIMKALGVDINAGPTEALRQFAARASAIEDAATKTAVFRDVLGKSGDALIPLFANLDEATERARKMGGTLREDAAAAAEKLNDALTRLSATGRIVTTNMLTPMVVTLADIADGISKAAERGEKWNQVLRETVKLGAAAMGRIGEGLQYAPGIFGLAGRGMAMGGEAMFNAMTPTARGVPGWSDGNKPVLPPPNAAALNAALTPEELKRQQEEMKRLAEQRKKEIDEMLKRGIKSEEEAADARYKIAEQLYYDMGQLEKRALDERTRGFREMYESNLQASEAAILDEHAMREAMDEGRRQRAQREQLERERDMAEQMRDQMRMIEQQSRRNEDAVRSLGLTFTSAFEDAIVKGKGLRDVLDGIAQDIARIVLRKSVTEPLGGALSQVIGGFFGGGREQPLSMAHTIDWSEGLGFAHGGSFMVGGAGGVDSQFVAFRASPNERVTVETPAQQNAGRGLVYSPVLNIDARGADAGVEQRLRRSFGGMLAEHARDIAALVEGQANRRGRRMGLAT